MQNILIIRGGALGDFILTFPALHALRKSFPDAHIELMASPSFLPLSRKYIDKGEGIDKNGIWNFFARNGELPEDLKKYFRRFDLVILLRPDKEGAFRENLKIAGVKKNVYHNTASINNKHFSIQIIDSLLPLGVTDNEYIPEIDFTEEEIEFAEEFLTPLHPHFIKGGSNSCDVAAIHPGSGSEKKNWTAEGFAEAAKILSERGFKVVLISGPADKKTNEKFLNLLDFSPVIAENLPIMKLAAIIKRCSFYIGNDSGVTHLAALTGIKTIAIYSHTDPAVWHPIGKKVTVIKRDWLEDVGAKEVLAYL